MCVIRRFSWLLFYHCGLWKSCQSTVSVFQYLFFSDTLTQHKHTHNAMNAVRFKDKREWSFVFLGEGVVLDPLATVGPTLGPTVPVWLYMHSTLVSDPSGLLFCFLSLRMKPSMGFLLDMVSYQGTPTCKFSCMFNMFNICYGFWFISFILYKRQIFPNFSSAWTPDRVPKVTNPDSLRMCAFSFWQSRHLQTVG